MRMSDPQRLKGWWFLATEPDKRVPGVLGWNQETGADLELIGGLSGRPEYKQVSERVWQTDTLVPEMPPSTIYGETDAGRPVTLWGAEPGNYKADLRHRVREEFWHSSWACLGAHLPTADAPAFRGLTVALDDLYYLTGDGRFCTPQWASIEGVANPGEQQEDGTLLLPYVIPVVGGLRAALSSGSTGDTAYYVDTYATRPPATPATEAMPDLKLSMMTKHMRSGPQIELSIGAQARIAPIDDAAWSAVDLLGRISPLRGLMRLATFADSGVEWMRAETLDGDNVSLLCHLGHPSAPDLPTETGGVVFTLDDVPLDQFLQTWQRLTSREQASFAWNIVVGLIGHSPRMVEENISQVVAAAEGLHRWCLGGGARKTLNERLVSLHDRLPVEVKAQLQVDVNKWAGWATWARNHVGHGGAERHREVDNFYQLKVIADSVRLITYLVALQEISVPAEKVKDALLNHPRISVLASRCIEIADLPDL